MIKKIIHYNYFHIKKTKLIIPNTTNHIIKNHYLYINNDTNKKLHTLVLNQLYKLKIKLQTKHLFLFTLYLLYNKFKNNINPFFFKFNINLKKQKRFTILRAPSNHKNSKEQYGITEYNSEFFFKFPSFINKYYHNFIIQFFKEQKIIGLKTLTYIIKKNE